jgi:hypothetical protein
VRVAALSKEGDEAVARMRAVYDQRRKLMVELMREVGFVIPVLPQGAFYVFADASRWTDDPYAFAFGQAGGEVELRVERREYPGGREEAGRVFGERNSRSLRQ